MSKGVIAVAGAGPAGLFAAWACINSGYRVHFVAPFFAKPKINAGVFVLHDRMNLPLREREVEYFAHGGTAGDYRDKVYGHQGADVHVSWPGVWPVLFAQHYDAAQAIDLVWDILDADFAHRRSKMRQGPVTFSGGGISARIPSWDALLERYAKREARPHFDGLINTIPLDALLPDMPYIKAWVKTGEAPADEAYIMYNANPAVPWYRASAAFGRFTLEFPDGVLYPEEQDKLTMVKKVLPGAKIPEYDHNRILLTGRYGAWDKSKLSHDAYTDTMNWLATREA